MGSLESLKQIADYRESPEGGYLSKSTFGVGTSRALTLVKNTAGEDIIAVAPRSFFGHFLSWVMPSKVNTDIQSSLKNKIQQSLIKVGINENDATKITTQVLGNDPGRSITRRDLRAMIKMAENIRGFSLKPIEPTSQRISVPMEDRLSSTIVSPEMGNISGEENFREVDPSAKKEAEELIQDSKQLLKEVTFDPKEVLKLRERVERQRARVESHFVNYSPNAKEESLHAVEEEHNASSSYQEKFVLPAETLVQLGEQRDHLVVKEKMLSQYLEGNPFSDKNVHYPRMIYAEAAKLVVEAQLPKDEGNRSVWPPALKGKFDPWYQAEVDSYKKADPTKRSQEPDFYLSKTNPENPLVKYKGKYVVDALNRLFSEAGLPAGEILEQEITEAAAIAMNHLLDWKSSENDMVFSLGDKTQAYHQVSIPLSESETAVGADLRDKGIFGIIPSVRHDGRAPINARMTQLFKVEYVVNSTTGEREEKKVLLHERQQHGINDHFAIQNPHQRRDANISSMKQLIQSGAEADAAFIQEALHSSEKPAQIFYINTNLTTPSWTRSLGLTPKNDELTYSRHQGAAMKASEGVQTFSVLNPENSEERADVNLNVTCIDFRFPVNYAISAVSEDSRAVDPGMIIGGWSALKTHNEGEFRKLFGRLDAQAPIEGIMRSTYEKLEEKAVNGNEEALKLKREIDQQIKYVRHMFQTNAYKIAGEDRFKMPRHIDLLVNTFRQASELVDDHKVRVVNAGGCMSGKDREGVANAENEAAVIVQDLGGKMEPGQGGRYNDEAQAIYDSCMTGVVHNTRQVTGIGGSKNAQEIASQMGDTHAKIYAQGGARFVSA